MPQTQVIKSPHVTISGAADGGKTIFDGENCTTDPCSALSFPEGCTNCEVGNIAFVDFTGSAVTCEGGDCSGLRLTDVEVTGGAGALDCTDCDGLKVRNLDADGSDCAIDPCPGVVLKDCDTCSIADLTVSNYPDTGLACNACPNLEIDGCRFEGNGGNGAELINSSDVSFNESESRDNGMNGLFLKNSGGRFVFMTIEESNLGGFIWDFPDRELPEEEIPVFDLRGSTLFENMGGLGIDLKNDGVTTNDPGDKDRVQNQSVVGKLASFSDTQSAGPLQEGQQISGTLHSLPDTTFRIEFFSNEVCDPSGFGEGQFFIGSTDVTSDARGRAAYTVTLEEGIPLDHFLTSLTTSDALGTSEFSPCVAPTEIVEASFLYFPFVQADSGNFTGLATTSLIDDPAKLEYRAFNNLGGRANLDDNPGRSELAAGTQSARLSAEIFDSTDPHSVWVELRSATPDLGSFFQFGSGDLEQMDGGVAFTETAETLFFTRVFEGEDAFRGRPAVTTFYIANPNPEALEIRLSYFAPGAAEVLEATRPIGPQGRIEETAGDLFGQDVSGGYVKVEVTEGEGGLVGFQRIELTDDRTVLGLNASFEEEATQLFSAQLASGPGIFTNFGFVNTGDQARELTVTALGEDGSNLADPVAVTLGPGDSLQQDAADLFDFAEAAATALGLAPLQELKIGSLKVAVDGPGVIGDVIFGDPDNFTYSAALPLQAAAFTEAVFSQVANLPGVFFTGLAFFNPGSTTATIKIEVLAADKTKVGETTLTLEAGKRTSKLVPELVASSEGQAGGYVRITSDVPVIGQQLFGTTDLSLLSAVPPRVIQ